MNEMENKMKIVKFPCDINNKLNSKKDFFVWKEM